jgi:hypothetical protein
MSEPRDPILPTADVIRFPVPRPSIADRLRLLPLISNGFIASPHIYPQTYPRSET